MKCLYLIALLCYCIFISPHLFAQSNCSSLIALKEDKVEGTKEMQPIKPLIFFDKTDPSKHLMCFVFIILGQLDVIFDYNKAIVVNPKDEIKILFKDGSRTSFDEWYNNKNYKGQYNIVFSKTSSYTNEYGIPPPISTDSSIMKKPIDVIRFFSLDAVSDFTFKEEDAEILQKTIDCMFNKV